MPSFHWWRTVFWLIPAISVYTIVLGALSLASMAVDRRGRLAHGCARLWSRLILVTTGVRVHAGGGGLVAPGRSYVFVSNHQSIYDFPVLITSIPFQLRILAKASLGAFPVLGWHLRYTGHLLVDRTRAGRATLNQVAAMIRRGHSLIVFPEGTRSRDGRVGPFKRGLFLLAIDAGVPVVPVALERKNAVLLLREIVGVTDSAAAARGTIRRDFGTNVQRNAVHASDSVETADDEIAFFFGANE